MILIDSDVLIDVSRNVPEALEALQHVLRTDDPAISVVTQMELIVGCRDRRELRILDTFLRGFEVIKLNEMISDRALDLLHNLRLTHGLLIADSLIAASALIHKAPFISKNSKHFRFIQGLELLPYPL